MILKNRDFTVEIDEKSGATNALYGKDSDNSWILSGQKWGIPYGFFAKSVEPSDSAVTVTAENEKRSVRIIITKLFDGNDYLEKYEIINCGNEKFHINNDSFCIPFPYDCLYTPGRDVLNDCCISHIWCGGDSAWIYSVRCHGNAPYLVMNTTEGAIDSYSIDYDLSLAENGSFFRGVFLLHPRECVIDIGGSVKIAFRYRFSDKTPMNAPLDYKGAVRLTSDKYTYFKGETVNIKFESESGAESVSLTCDGNSIPCRLENGVAYAKFRIDSLGEKTLTATLGDKKTFIRINAIENTDTILQRRAKFITEKQQYHENGSPLDGAYLIYDSETDSLHYDGDFADHNASRERIGMGITVALALQAQYDEKIMKSLEKHRSFVERELFDEETATVYNHIGRNNDWLRVYNFPWLSTYYYEWYMLSGEIKCLENSARILIRFFEISKHLVDAQCIEAVKICRALEKEGMTDLKDNLTSTFLIYADRIAESFWTAEGESEICYVSELPNDRLAYLSQAFALTGNKKYADAAESYLRKTEAFFGDQPDYHLNCINVRYWDRRWFGKVASYGDLFPHYWSTLAGWAMSQYDEHIGCNQLGAKIYSNLSGNLCVYRDNGFAHNNYLYPYKVYQHASDPTNVSKWHTHGIFKGKNYDAYANDQDFALYYASTIL
ncbi:MAG: hypothetical protein IKA74_04310 [Clostridia bacterium]|nr:hypothetical protein [Clostridia bacterium]